MIERLHPSDWQRLKTLRLAALTDSPDAFASTLDSALKLDESDWKRNLRDLATFVATIDQVDQGMVRCAPDKESPSRVFLISLWVAPTARRHGIAEKLIQASMGWALSAGYSQMLLDVGNDNAPAIALYGKLLFKPNGETATLPFPREHIAECRWVRDL